MSELRGDLTVVVPTHNEALVLGRVLDELRCHLPDADILVVDDGSSDGSAEVARAHGVRVLRHEQCRGYGAAIKSAVAVSEATQIAIIDADGTYAPAELARLRAVLPTGGMVVGARSGEPSWLRGTVKACARRYVRLHTGARVPDLNSGMRIFTRELFLRLAPLLPDRFSLTTTMTLGALALGAEVRFVPVSYASRVGRSKFRAKDAWRFAGTVARGVRWMRDGTLGSPDSAAAAAPAGRPPWLRWSVAVLAAAVMAALAPASAELTGVLVPCALAALAYGPFFLAKVIRWRRLLTAAGVELEWRAAVEAYLAGMALGAVTPGRVGELVRIVGPARLGHPVAALAYTTVVDRMLDLGVVVLVGAAAATAAPQTLGTPYSFAGVAALLGLGALGVWLSLPVSRVVVRRLVRRVDAAPGGDSERRLWRPLVLLEAGLWTVVSMALYFSMTAALLAAAGVHAPWPVLVGAVAAGNLAALAPVSVAGLGTREGAVVAVLAASGYGAGAATMALFACTFHVVFTLTPWLLVLGHALLCARWPRSMVTA